MNDSAFFIPALLVSTVIHGVLIAAGARIPSAADVAVREAPSSLEVTVVYRPVVSVLSSRIVSQEIAESHFTTSDVILSPKGEGSQSVEILPPTFRRGQNDEKGGAASKDVRPSAASEASQGAVTKAKPVAYFNPAPLYPQVARKRGWEGLVRLEVLVGKDGHPGPVTVVKSSGHDALDEAAVTTVKDWKFLPARSGAERLASRVTIPIQFTLTKE